MMTNNPILNFACIILIGIAVLGSWALSNAEVVFRDDFAGIAVDTTKWREVSVVLSHDPQTPAPQYGSCGQDEHLWFLITEGDSARGHAITKRTFTPEDNLIEVEVWQDDVPSWQDWPIFLITHLAAFGYYNGGFGDPQWYAEWIDSQGQRQLLALPFPRVTPWTKYKMSIQLVNGVLTWRLESPNGRACGFYTMDFSLPHNSHWQHPDYPNRIILASSDIGTTYWDNLLVSRICQYPLVGDLNDDCKVDLLDLAMMAESWLIDCNLNPGDPGCAP